MSTVGLTKAMRRVLERDGYSAAALARAIDAGLVNPDPGAAWLTPRGHAALAAPRMTDKQYTTLAYVARGMQPAAPLRIMASLERNGWIERAEWGWTCTHAGRTALNNVRAAMTGEWRQVGSQDWKEGL